MQLERQPFSTASSSTRSFIPSQQCKFRLSSQSKYRRGKQTELDLSFVFFLSGFNVETVEFGKFNLTLWDVGGQDKIRQLWGHYYSNSDALIYVVDSADRARIDVAADELHHVLSAPELQNAVLLILANKQDLPGALSPGEVADKLRVGQLKDRPWHIQGCCASNGTGLYEGLTGLTKLINNNVRK
jgi:ADP-ribosylation factor protein 1